MARKIDLVAPLDAEGNTISAEQVQAFLKELP
jgi:hypothetical protein